MDRIACWGALTAPEIAALDRARAIAGLPVVAIEPHGPHLGSGTEADLAQAVLARALPRLASDLLRIEGWGRIVRPALTDPHVYLDKCHTAHRLPGIGGDLIAATAAQARDKSGWTAADIRAR